MFSLSLPFLEPYFVTTTAFGFLSSCCFFGKTAVRIKNPGLQPIEDGSVHAELMVIYTARLKM